MTLRSCWSVELAAEVAGYFASPPIHPPFHFVVSQSLFPVHPHLYSRPHSHSDSRLHPCARGHSRSRSRSRFHPSPCHGHRFLTNFPRALFPLLGSISSGRGLVSRLKLQGALRCHWLFAEIIPRRYWQCPVFYSIYFFPGVMVDTRAFPCPPSLNIVVPVPISDPVSVPHPVLVYATAFVSIPASVLVSISLAFSRLRIHSHSRPVPVHVPVRILRPLSRLRLCPRSRSRNVPFPVTVFVPCSIPPPSPSPSPPPTQSPSLFIPSRNSDLVTPSVQIHLHIHRASGTKLSRAHKLHSLSAKKMTRAE